MLSTEAPPRSGNQDVTEPARRPRIDGVVIGLLVGFDGEGRPLVAYPGNPIDGAVNARCTAWPNPADAGREVALLFEGGDPALPVLIGVVQRARTDDIQPGAAVAQLDGQRLVLSAEREVVLQCGKASITLTREGKVLIRGSYVLSRSSGAQRIRGATVEIN